MRKFLAILCALAAMLQLCACSAPREESNISCQAGNAQELTAKLTRSDPETLTVLDFSPENQMADFSVSLLQNCAKSTEGNCILSPYSAAIALAMTANGAAGDTLDELEKLTGMSAEEWSSFLYFCGQKSRNEVTCANSIWLRDGITAGERFLQTNLDYFNAQIFRAPFNDLTVDEVNEWVKEQTKGRIEKLVDSFGEDTVMLLMNAMTFDGVWETPFSADDTRTGYFSAADGREQTVQMMHGSAWAYLDDGKATGFWKDYQNGYRFVALLPNEDVSMEEYLQSFSGSGLLRTMENASQEEVLITVPKLDSQCTMELSEALQNMGVQQAFGRQADFSPMGGDYYLSAAVQKTSLKVDEEGTETGVATMIVMDPKSVYIPNEKTVVLDRPFVLAIQDTQTGVFLFLGVIEQV